MRLFLLKIFYLPTKLFEIIQEITLAGKLKGTTVAAFFGLPRGESIRTFTGWRLRRQV
jgi:hypothetical protein